MGMSWPLSWTYDETLDTPIPAIELAYGGSWKGLQKVVQAVAGGGEQASDAKAEQPKPLSIAMVQSVFEALAG